jgi:hypothetical protein
VKFELKDMYSFLISHTFPGLLVLVEILLFYQWCVNPSFWDFVQQNPPTEAGVIILLLILVYALSTLLGIILDGVHHFILEDFLRKKTIDNKFTAIKDDLSMAVYRHFLEDDLWYPYESYANVSLAMVPGVGLFWHWLSSILHLAGWHFWLPLLLYVAVLVMTLCEAIYTYQRFLIDEEEFIRVYSARQTANPSKGD